MPRFPNIHLERISDFIRNIRFVLSFPEPFSLTCDPTLYQIEFPFVLGKERFYILRYLY